jgi:hypothetical protein
MKWSKIKIVLTVGLKVELKIDNCLVCDLEGGCYTMLALHIEEDGDVRSECEQDKDTDCKYGDSDTDW